MYQLIKSLPIVLVVFFYNNLFSHDGETHKLKGHSKADMLEQCVEPTEVMQKEHFGLLYHQRDKTVIKGIRTKEHSLANCIDCHVSYDDNGAALPINSEGQFCQTCHVQTAVNIDCFTCHATVPRDKKVDNKLQKNLKKTMNLEQDTTSLVRYFNEQNNE